MKKNRISYELQSDEELMIGYKNGDRKAFDILITKYKKPILNYIYRYIGDYQQAQDLTQETFFHLHRAAQDYRRIGKFSAWLYRIATNLCKNELRRRARHSTVSTDTPITDGKGKITTLLELIPSEGKRLDDELTIKELDRQIREIISSLPDIHREVVIMRLFQGLSFKEISEILGCSVGAVKERMYYAIEKIRSKFY